MFKVFVKGIEFYAFHGVPAEERVVGHRYRVDIEMQVEGDASFSDSISGTADYGAISQLVVEVGTTVQVQTVERLSRLIGERILELFTSVQSLTIRISKPFPPAPVIAAEAGCELEISR